MIRGVAFMPGIPAAGHISGHGFWHAGSLDSCPKCETITTHAVPSRGANLMTETITADPADTEADPSYCQFEAVGPDFDGTTIAVPCGAPATHWPVIDDVHAAHLRATGVDAEEAQPFELPTCDEHYAQLLTDIEGQEHNDPHRIWIAAERCELVIGYTKVIRPTPGEGMGYVPMSDGYRPGAEQHEVTIMVPLPVNLQPFRIAELVFIATNAPELDPDSTEELIRLAIEDTGYKGVEAHWSLSVGDTVTVQGGPRLACQHAGWAEVKA